MAREQEPSLRIGIAAEIPKAEGGYAFDVVEIRGDTPEARELLDFYMSVGNIAVNIYPISDRHSANLSDGQPGRTLLPYNITYH